MTSFRSAPIAPMPIPGAWTTTGRIVVPRSQTIKQLINDALEVQEGLNTVKNRLSQLERNESTSELLVIALDCQERFFNLLATSRDSASILMAHLEDFTHNIVPLVQDETVSLSDKLIEVKGSAEMISTTAQQSPFKTQEQLKPLKIELTRLEELVNAYTKGLEAYADIPMREISEKIEELESDITHTLMMRGGLFARAFNTLIEIQPRPVAAVEPLDRLPPPNVSRSLVSFIQDFQEVYKYVQQFLTYQTDAAMTTQQLEQKRHELESWKIEVDVKQAEIRRALNDLRTLKQHFTVLDGKLGNFEEVWEKLMQDVRALDHYLENPWSGISEEDFQDRIRTEGVLYREIRGALEMYAIQSRRSN